MKRPLSLLRKGSASRRVWTSPPIPTERYELRPCLCVFVARFDRRIFYYSSKTDSSWECVAKVTASHLLMTRPLHCLSATPGCVTPPGWAHPYTIPSAAHQHCIHTRCILSCTAGGRRAARGREGERENRRWEGRRGQGAGGREEAMM